MASPSYYDMDIFELAAATDKGIDRYLPRRIHALKTLPFILLLLLGSAYLPHAFIGTPQTYADGIFVLKLVFFFLIFVAPYLMNGWEDRRGGAEVFRLAMAMWDTGCSWLYVGTGSESGLRVISAFLWIAFCDTAAFALVVRSVFRARPPRQTEGAAFEFKVALKGVDVEPV